MTDHNPEDTHDERAAIKADVSSQLEAVTYTAETLAAENQALAERLRQAEAQARTTLEDLKVARQRIAFLEGQALAGQQLGSGAAAPTVAAGIVSEYQCGHCGAGYDAHEFKSLDVEKKSKTNRCPKCGGGVVKTS